MCKRRKKKKKTEADACEEEIGLWIKEQRVRLAHIDDSIEYYKKSVQAAKDCVRLNREQRRIMLRELQRGERDLARYRKSKKKKK